MATHPYVCMIVIKKSNQALELIAPGFERQGPFYPRWPAQAICKYFQNIVWKVPGSPCLPGTKGRRQVAAGLN